MEIRARVTDIATGEIMIITEKNPVLHRVMSRAAKLYKQAKALGIHGVRLSYYVQYSWRLEKGFIWQ